MFVVAIGIAGLANGIYLAVDAALIAEVLPSRTDVGKDMGVLHLANVLPQTLVPVTAPLFLAIGGTGDNYPALFIGGAIVGIIGADREPIHQVRALTRRTTVLASRHHSCARPSPCIGAGRVVRGVTSPPPMQPRSHL